jgi:hypothetical protein
MGMRGDCRMDSVLDMPLADILSRYPEAAGLFIGSGFSLFADRHSLEANGGLMLVGEAIEIRGICPDLFQLLLEESIAEQQRPRAA